MVNERVLKAIRCITYRYEFVADVVYNLIVIRDVIKVQFFLFLQSELDGPVQALHQAVKCLWFHPKSEGKIQC